MNKRGKYPDEKECYALLEKHNVLPNILAHSVKVMNVSLAIGKHLNPDTALDMGLIRASALLHDIAKSGSIRSGDYRHDITGGEILREIGYNSVAEIVERHIFLKGFNPAGRLEEWEIVHYSDKRVMHDTIVTVEQRINDIVKRYRLKELDDEFVRKSREKIHSLEKKIQGHMNAGIDEALAEL